MGVIYLCILEYFDNNDTYFCIVYSTVQSIGVDFNYELTTYKANKEELKYLSQSSRKYTSTPHAEMLGSCDPGMAAHKTKF